jgi:hypothetical protein
MRPRRRPKYRCRSTRTAAGHRGSRRKSDDRSRQQRGRGLPRLHTRGAPGIIPPRAGGGGRCAEMARRDCSGNNRSRRCHDADPCARCPRRVTVIRRVHPRDATHTQVRVRVDAQAPELRHTRRKRDVGEQLSRLRGGVRAVTLSRARLGIISPMCTASSESLPNRNSSISCGSPTPTQPVLIYDRKRSEPGPRLSQRRLEGTSSRHQPSHARELDQRLPRELDQVLQGTVAVSTTCRPGGPNVRDHR